MQSENAHYKPADGVAVASLLAGATVWGLIWFPYRVLEQAGLPGLRASVLTYFVALVLGVIFLAPRLRCERPPSLRSAAWLLAVGLSAGACNIGYVLGMLHGEVMRVLLLFYLAPLWTVLLARLLLGERLTRAGAAVVTLSLCGAAAMLWQPGMGLPWPQARAEWLGLAAGFLFALANVLIRKTREHSIELKSLTVFLGTVALGLTVLPFEARGALAGLQGAHWALVGGVGVVLLAVNLIVQHGLSHVPANRAIVIFLFELVVAGISSWLLAGEAMGAKEWLGGAMIVAASLFSARAEGKG